MGRVRVFSKSPTSALEGRWRLIFTRFPNSLSCMWRARVFCASHGDQEVHALVIGAPSLRFPRPAQAQSAPRPAEALLIKCSLVQAQGMFLLRKVFQVMRYPSTASSFFGRPWKRTTRALSGILGCRKKFAGGILQQSHLNDAIQSGRMLANDSRSTPPMKHTVAKSIEPLSRRYGSVVVPACQVEMPEMT